MHSVYWASLFFETLSPYVAQADLEPGASLLPQSPLCHHAWLRWSSLKAEGCEGSCVCSLALTFLVCLQQL